MLHVIETEQRKSRKSTRIGDTTDAMKSWTPLAPRTTLPLDRPLVFLESTVIAQGLPWPENLETALAMEAAVQASGAVPAMIAVVDGVVRLGLSAAEIEAVARFAETPATAESTGAADHHEAPPRPFSKANRRDLSAVLAQQGCAATTVSATLWLAQRLGKKPCIMTTGGLGGVHRAATETFDISTDLDELARADGSVVVCSGFKSILDLAATLEALESRGVAIVGYRTNELPAFITASSGLTLEHRVETPEAAAAVIRAHRNLGLPGAVVLANPVPAAEAVDREFVETVLESALADARRRKIAGKALTPFLLDSIRHATAGRSLRANRALLVSNARLAAQVAVALSD
jgi:pseudouridine-5'-phosphate glycosidase